MDSKELAEIQSLQASVFTLAGDAGVNPERIMRHAMHAGMAVILAALNDAMAQARSALEKCMSTDTLGREGRRVTVLQDALGLTQETIDHFSTVGMRMVRQAREIADAQHQWLSLPPMDPNVGKKADELSRLKFRLEQMLATDLSESTVAMIHEATAPCTPRPVDECEEEGRG